MTYDPFARGAHPVGVRTIEIRDTALAAGPVLAELWYPAIDAHRGHDLDDAFRDRFEVAAGLPAASQDAVRDAAPLQGTCPLFMYFHGAYGHRRECTTLCTHLASHGYVVGSIDFPGDNIRDMMPGPDGSPPAVTKTPVDESAARRPVQASLFLGHIIAMGGLRGLRVSPDLIGTGGMSMGGFTSLALNSVDRRPRASFPMCPMFGERSLVPQMARLAKLLRVDDWQRLVPTCLLTGELDPLVNVEDMHVLYRQLATPKRLVVLRRAGHVHFADGAEMVHELLRQGYLSGEFSDPELKGDAGIALGKAMRPFAELCTEAQSGGTARALCLAHLDTHLRAKPEARAFLGGDLVQTFADELGVSLDVMVETFDEATVV
jgi:dienelactone hydrolase